MYDTASKGWAYIQRGWNRKQYPLQVQLSHPSQFQPPIIVNRYRTNYTTSILRNKHVAVIFSDFKIRNAYAYFIQYCGKKAENLFAPYELYHFCTTITSKNLKQNHQLHKGVMNLFDWKLNDVQIKVWIPIKERMTSPEEVLLWNLHEGMIQWDVTC
jgi:hypothetical protein